MTTRARRIPMLIAGCALGVLALTGCREEPPPPDGSGTASPPTPTATATEEPTSQQDNEQHLADAVTQVLGETSETVTGEDVFDNIIRRQQLGDVVEADPAQCMQALTTQQPAESEEEDEDGSTSSPDPSATQETTAAEAEDGAAARETMTQAAAGTLVDASEPGTYIIQQLTVIGFENAENAAAYLEEQRRWAAECPEVEVTLAGGAHLNATTELTELDHHTDESLEIVDQVTPVEAPGSNDDNPNHPDNSNEEPEETDQADQADQSAPNMPPVDVSTVMVRDGDQVYSYLTSEQTDVAHGLTHIDQLTELLSAESPSP